MEDLTAEQINIYIDKFLPIYTNGREGNPIPENVKITVWHESLDGEESGFSFNTTKAEMGLEIFIAKSWIRQSELEFLFESAK